MGVISGRQDRAIRSRCLDEAALGPVDVDALRRMFGEAAQVHGFEETLTQDLASKPVVYALESCYEASLLADETIGRGRLVLRFEVDESGQIRAAELDANQSEIQAPGLGDCVASALDSRHTELPKLDASVTFNFSWR